MPTNEEIVHAYVDELYTERERDYRADIGEIILRGTHRSDTDPYLRQLRQRSLEDIARRPQRLQESTLPMLKALSDEHALPVWAEDAKDHVVEFTVSFPGSHTEETPGLTIYSIPDGFRGFNTSTVKKDDNSKRWTVYLDRGTNFGAAYDNRGTAYANGKYDPSTLYTRVDADQFETVVQSFFDRDDLTIDWRVLPTDEERAAQIASSTTAA